MPGKQSHHDWTPGALAAAIAGYMANARCSRLRIAVTKHKGKTVEFLKLGCVSQSKLKLGVPRVASLQIASRSSFFFAAFLRGCPRLKKHLGHPRRPCLSPARFGPGRTGRIGNHGWATSFYVPSPADRLRSNSRSGGGWNRRGPRAGSENDHLVFFFFFFFFFFFSGPGPGEKNYEA